MFKLSVFALMGLMELMGAALPQDAARASQESARAPQPATILGSCEADLTGDGRTDLVVLRQLWNGTELVALAATEDGGYRAFVLRREEGKPGILKCEAGARGAFISLTWPRECSVSFVWLLDHFEEIFTG